MSNEMDLIEWDCPQCGDTNYDIPNQSTHCASCGRVVFVLDEDDSFHDLHYEVSLEVFKLEKGANNVEK